MPIKGLKGGIGSKALGYGLGGAEEATDAEFNQTVLLLHGDGSEGAGDTAALGDPNYKAFKDNSTSAHAITVQGDAYGNDFSPYYYADGYWSNFFDGNGDYFSIAASSDFLYTGDFTIEFWIYPLEFVDYDFIVGTGGSGQQDQMNMHANGTIGYFDGSVYTFSPALNLNAWNHCAVTRSGTTIRFYANGVSGTSGTKSGNLGSSSNALRIGERSDGNYDLNAYLSNLRIVNGTAVYTGTSHTVPTAPLTAVTNTKLLTCQSNRFVDNSTSGHSITVSGTPKISTNTPFTVTKTANVGSGFFQRTTDYLTSINTATNFGTSDFTMECWVYYTALPPSNSSHSYIYGMNSGSHEVLWYLYYNSTSGQYQYTFRDPDVSSLVRTLITPTTHEWIHLAVVRSGTTITLFQNGQALTPSQVGDAGSHSYTCDEISVGGTSSLNGSFDGYIADVRVINGTALYTSNFTPPTSSLTAVADTTFLTCQYSGAVRNVGFLDDSKYNHQITRGGDVNMGTFSPFSLEDGYWSNFFDGTGDYLNNTSNALITQTVSTFTVEGWIYMTSNPTSDANNISGFITLDGQSNNIYNYLAFGPISNRVLYLRWFDGSSKIANGSTTLNLNQWYHIACVVNSNAIQFYVDGVAESMSGTTTLTNRNSTTSNFSIGAHYYGSIAGYISNLRVTTTAVYTSNFTPSGSLTAIANTSLLTCQSNRFVDNSTTGHTLTPGGTPKVQPFSPFAPSRSYSKDAVGGSAYFDGSGDGLNAGTSAVFLPVANADFTFEAWVYLTATPTYAQIMGVHQWATSSDWIVYVGSDLVPDLWIQAANSGAGVTYAGSTAINLNEWTHIAWSRSGTGSNNMKLFINGVQDAQYTYTGTTVGTGTTGLTLGSDGGFDQAFLTGYISNPRIINGTGLYTSAFTPPTAPFLDSDSNYDNTTFLARFDNAGIIDHTMKNNLETEGNVRISGQQTKFGTGSIYFDGTGDFLRTEDVNDYLAMGSGDWTFELFVHATSLSGARFIWDQRPTGSQGVYPALYWTGSALDFYVSTGSRISGSSAISVDTWHHVALCKSSGSTKLFVDGTQVGSTYTDSNNYLVSHNIFGASAVDLAAPFLGYMDEIRLTKGVARYTSNFTAPTKAFANR